MSDLPLKTNFPTEVTVDWRALAEKGLRGKTVESLMRKTEDGINRGPLTCAEDLPPALAVLARTNLPLLDDRAWHIAAPVRDSDIGHANTQLLEDLKGGASAIRIENSLNLSNRSDLKRLLEGVYTDLVPIHFANRHFETEIFEHVKSLKALETAVIWTGLDPMRASETLRDNVDNSPSHWRLMGISAADIHEAGGTDIQELSVLAGRLAEAMRVHGPEAVCRHMVIDIAADRDTHLTIAKFRAARRIILRIADAHGSDGSGIPLCAVTSLRMMQTQDAWTNLLRVMSAGFGAVIGGADMIVTRPFTDGLGSATGFAHRIARNMQLMMMEESHLGQVSDAAHGSYWHENITDQLAQMAWKAFQSIESEGGISAYRESGKLQADIDKAATKREAESAPVLGVTLHPATDVKAPEVRS